MDRRRWHFAVPLLHNQSIGEHLDGAGLSFSQCDPDPGLFEDASVFPASYAKLDPWRSSNISVGCSCLDRKSHCTVGYFPDIDRAGTTYTCDSILLRNCLRRLRIFSAIFDKKSYLCIHAVFISNLPWRIKMAKDT